MKKTILSLLLLLLPAAANARPADTEVQRQGPVAEGPRSARDIDVRFLQVSPSDPSVVAGTSLQMQLLLVLPHREPVNVSQFVTRWISSTPALASVDRRGRVSARCAGDQGKYWEMRQALFAASGSDLSRDGILKDAQTLSLDESNFAACLDSEKHKTEIQADLAESTRLRITGTPTFVIGKSGKETLDGVKINGALPLSAFDAAIRQASGTAQ